MWTTCCRIYITVKVSKITHQDRETTKQQQQQLSKYSGQEQLVRILNGHEDGGQNRTWLYTISIDTHMVCLFGHCSSIINWFMTRMMIWMFTKLSWRKTEHILTNGIRLEMMNEWLCKYLTHCVIVTDNSIFTLFSISHIRCLLFFKEDRCPSSIRIT